MRLRTRTDCIEVVRESIETGTLKDATQTYTACPIRPNDLWGPLEFVTEEEDDAEEG